MLKSLSTTSTRGNDTRSALHDRLRRLERIKASDNHNISKMFRHLQRQVSALQAVNPTSLHMQFEKRTVSTGVLCETFHIVS